MNTPASPANVVWHTKTPEQVFAELNASPRGLTSEEAARRLAQHGPNELHAGKQISPWSILFSQFKNILILILLVAAGLSGVLGHAVEAIAIAVIVVFAVLLGFYQEYRAERAMEALSRMAAPTAAVLRDGQERDLPARDLVPGDMIVLRAGANVPADLRLLETANLQIEEAPLTGESVPSEKSVAVLDAPDLAVGDRRNIAYAGTSVSYGRGRGIVVATAMHTEFGKIAQMLQSVETVQTPLQQNLDRAGRGLAKAALVIVGVVVALGIFRGQPWLEMFIFGIALAVAVVPEALPAVVTISLALGVQRMVRRNALIRRLPAVETLGSTSVICSDKTGTLTRDEMMVRRIYVSGQIVEVSGSGYDVNGEFTVEGKQTAPSPSLRTLLQAAALNSDATMEPPSATGEQRGAGPAQENAGRSKVIKGDPTEGALVVAAAKAGLRKAELESQWPRTYEVPFTSETKRMTTVHSGPTGTVAYSKGAPEIILEACTRKLESDQSESPLTAADRAAILDQSLKMAAQALRVLALAQRNGATNENAEREMTFLGLTGMIDPPRPEAKAAIETCRQAGIRAVMITGDHPVTGQAVARELGLLRNGRVLTGAELDKLSDADFERIVEEVEVYARVSPAHKLRVVSALQKHEHVVAMTGDGVNDAPALKKADIGIAMGITGTDVTKEAAAMTLTDDNFASIVAAVEEGRGIFSNVRKYLIFLLSSNIGEILLILGAAVLGLPVPLTAVQILYVNLATDGLPALALAVDPPEADLMRLKPRKPRAGIFTRPVMVLMLVGGLWSAAVNLGLFAWALGTGRSLVESMTMVFATLVLIEFLKAYNFRSDRHSLWRRPFANKWLNYAILWEILLLLIVINVEALHQAFGNTTLSWPDWTIIIALAFTIVPVVELAKWMMRRGWFGANEETA